MNESSKSEQQLMFVSWWRRLLLLGALCSSQVATLAVSTKRNYTFAMVPKSADNPYFTFARDGCMEAAAIWGVNCLWVEPSVDDTEGMIQQQLVFDLIANKTRSIDGLAISVMQEAAIQPAIEAAIKANIPVVTFDSDAPSSKRIAYIGTNNTFFGSQLGKVVKQLLPNGGYYAMIGGNSPNFIDREHGLRSELQAGPDRNHVWIEMSNSPSDMEENATLAIQQIYEFAAQKPAPTVIIPLAGLPMRSGLWKDMVDKTRHLNITFVSGDAMNNQLDLLNREYAHGLVGQLPYEMGYHAIQVLKDLAQNSGNGNVTKEFIGTNILTHIYVPLVLPDLYVNTNLVGDLLIVGDILFGLVVVAALVFAMWTIINRKVRVVQVSQPLFLIMMAIGVLIMGSSLVPMSFGNGGDPSQESRGILSCMSVPWLGCIGFTITFATLHLKLQRVYRLFRSSKSFQRVKVTERDVMAPLLILLAANIAILLAWTFLDPLVYVRRDYPGVDGWGRTIASYGACRSRQPAAYLVPLAVVNIGVLLLANWNAYRARGIESEFSESKHIAIAMGSLLQALLSGVPISFVVRDLPKAFYLVLAFTVFITCMAVLFVIFVPKIMIAENFAKYSKREQDQMIRKSIESSIRSLELQKTSSQGLQGMTSQEGNRRQSQNLSDMSGEISFSPSLIRELEEGERMVRGGIDGIVPNMSRDGNEGNISANQTTRNVTFGPLTVPEADQRGVSSIFLPIRTSSSQDGGIIPDNNTSSRERLLHICKSCKQISLSQDSKQEAGDRTLSSTDQTFRAVLQVKN